MTIDQINITMEKTRKSQRLIKKPKKYSDAFIDEEEIENDLEIDTNTIVKKMSELKTVSPKKINTRQSSRFNKNTPSKMLVEVSGEKMAQKTLEVTNSSYNINLKTAEKNESAVDLENFKDFSDSESEYTISDSLSSSDSEDEISDEIQEINKSPKKYPRKSDLRNKNNDNIYIMKPDDYFSSQTSKIHTSNHTLQKLKNPKLSEEQLQTLLGTCNSSAHEKFIHQMIESKCKNFSEWILYLQEGFNILLYGLGSKRNILNAFQTEIASTSPVIVINGYFPSLTIKDVMDSILLDIFENSSTPGNVYEAVELIEKQCRKFNNTIFYLIVHNIDGPMLRNNKSQSILSSLADIPNIHLLASIDHINTPLIWDHSKLSKFNFIWCDATSFLPYSEETSFESSMLVQRSGALALSSLGNVYQSLTKNSKGIFMLIVKYQLSNATVKYYQGMPFKILYSKCRENFLVSSDLALRTQLTEFLDHKLMKSKRAADGVEHLLIPINNSLLQQFVEQFS